MSRPTDKQRILHLVSEAGQLSNPRIRNELELAEGRYRMVIEELIEEGLVERYRCRGGGIRITTEGEKGTGPADAESDVNREKDLYTPLCNYLRSEDEPGDTPTVVCDTSNLKKRGQWQNPDVTRIAVEVYPILHKHRVVVTSYEVKQWGRWSVSAVFEAASHDRFVHQSYVVLEWPKSAGKLSLVEHGVDRLVQECYRFGVGLATLRPHYTTYRLVEELAPETRTPDDEDLETWLDYVFSRKARARSEFVEAMKQAFKGINASREDTEDT